MNFMISQRQRLQVISKSKEISRNLGSNLRKVAITMA